MCQQARWRGTEHSLYSTMSLAQRGFRNSVEMHPAWRGVTGRGENRNPSKRDAAA